MVWQHAEIGFSVIWLKGQGQKWPCLLFVSSRLQPNEKPVDKIRAEE